MTSDYWTVVVEFAVHADERTAARSRLMKYVGERVRLTTNSFEAPILEIDLNGPGVREVINRALGRMDGEILAGSLHPSSVRAFRRGGREPVPDLAGLSEVARRLGVSRQRAGQITHQHDFPMAVSRLAMGPVYTVRGIDEFKDQWARNAGRPRALSRTRLDARKHHRHL